MKRFIFISLISLVALGAGILPTSVFAGTLDEQFTCKSNAHTFITSLINSQLIDPAPIRVEANSVNAFRPAHGRDLADTGYAFAQCSDFNLATRPSDQGVVSLPRVPSTARWCSVRARLSKHNYGRLAALQLFSKSYQ
jgi:hypothetical protein